jgi:hypothetical protein
MVTGARRAGFYETITAAVNDMALHGYDLENRLQYWLLKIDQSARANLIPAAVLEASLKSAFQRIYTRLVEQDGLSNVHIGVDRYTLDKLRPALRNELDRRILASASLIKLNREQAIRQTLHRFTAWSTSIPPGGTKATDKIDVKRGVRKALAQLPFEERRVAIDQGHKFVSAINEIVATSGGALAGIWHSNWRQIGYNYREDHKERDGRTYTVRGNWALQALLMHVGPNGYTDEITKPGEEIFCRCSYRYIYALRDLPAEMLTARGRGELQRVRVVQ